MIVRNFALVATSIIAFSNMVIAYDGFSGGFKINNEALQAKPYAWGKATSPQPVRSGDNSQRFELRDGDCMPDVTMCQIGRLAFRRSSNLKFRMNEEVWISQSVFLTKDFNTKDLNTNLFQIHHEGGAKVINSAGDKQHKFISLDCYQNQLNVDYRDLTGTEFDNEPKLSTIYSCANLKDKWTDILYHINFSKEDGFIEIYLNSSKVFDLRKGAKYQYKNLQGNKSVGKKENDFINQDIQSFYISFGLYITNAQSFRDKFGSEVPTTVLYVDEVRVGRSREDVDLRSNSELAPVD